MKSNVEIVREYIEKVTNDKQIDSIEEYISQECVFHGSPYVGLGFMIDDSSGEKIFVREIYPGAPAENHLQPGDEILRFSDADGTLETFEQLKSTYSMWGRGKQGTTVTLTVRRGEQFLEIPLVRGQVKAVNQTLASILDNWRKFLLEEMPDLKTDIKLIIGEGDWVAFYAITTGTSTEFNQSATWAEASFLRLQDGKVVETWDLGDSESFLRQLGYQILEPVKETVKKVD